MSVLSELFQNIANAIRDHDGYVGDGSLMAPAAFPDAIAALASGTSSSGGTEEWIGTGGSFKPTTTALKTITHNLGVVPDFVAVWAQGSVTLPSSGTYYISSFGLSSKFAESLSYSEDATLKLQYGTGIYVTNGGLNSLSVTMGIEDLTSASAACINTATETTVIAGSNLLYKLYPNLTYYWLAFARKS